MARLLNFGGSHAIGYNGDGIVYSDIISQKLNLVRHDFATAGASINYVIMRLLIEFKNISRDDVVVIQVPTHTSRTQHVDIRNDRHKILNYVGMTQLSLQNKKEDDFIYGLKYYKSTVTNDINDSLNWYQQYHLLDNYIASLPCKHFAFRDGIIRKPKTNLGYMNELYKLETKNIFPTSFKDFALELDIPKEQKFGRLEDGRPDPGHYTGVVHTPWAEVIMENL